MCINPGRADSYLLTLLIRNDGMTVALAAPDHVGRTMFEANLVALHLVVVATNGFMYRGARCKDMLGNGNNDLR